MKTDTMTYFNARIGNKFLNGELFGEFVKEKFWQNIGSIITIR